MSSDRSFNWRIIDEIEKLIDKAGMTRAEVIAKSGMRRNTFFVKMRGETALNTDDIAKLASALDVDPVTIFLNAAGTEDADPTVGGVSEHGDTDQQADYDLAARVEDDDRGFDTD